jgi:hypothetical protein
MTEDRFEPEGALPKERERSRSTWAIKLRRGALVLTWISFFLPFLTVEDCTTHRVSTYLGIELLFKETGVWLWIPIGLSLLLFGLSFLKRERTQIRLACNAGGRAVAAGVASESVVCITIVAFLFDDRTPEVGWWLCILGWTLVLLESWASALRAFLAHRRETEGVERSARYALFGPVFRAAALLGLATPLLAEGLVSLSSHGMELDELVGSVSVLLLISLPVAFVLECCVRAVSHEERWALWVGLGTSVATTILSVMVLFSVVGG